MGIRWSHFCTACREVMAEEDWADLKGYLRDTAKLPTTNVQSSKLGGKKRFLKGILVLSLWLVTLMMAVWCVHRCFAGGVLRAVTDNLWSCYNDMWTDLLGVDSPEPSLTELEDRANTEFIQEEHAYWSQVRPYILEQQWGEWVAVVGGKVVATGRVMNKVAAAAMRSTGKSVMFVVKVGYEEDRIKLLPGVTEYQRISSDDSGAQWYPLSRMSTTRSLLLNTHWLGILS